MVTVLVGNKVDMEAKRAVSQAEAQQFADENGLIYIETSAKTASNVEEAFVICTKQIYEKIKSNTIDFTSEVCG